MLQTTKCDISHFYNMYLPQGRIMRIALKERLCRWASRAITYLHTRYKISDILYRDAGISRFFQDVGKIKYVSTRLHNIIIQHTAIYTHKHTQT